MPKKFTKMKAQKFVGVRLDSTIRVPNFSDAKAAKNMQKMKRT